MSFSLRGLMIALLVLCAFLAGRMPVLRRAEEAEERLRALLTHELAQFANRTKVTAIVEVSKGDRQVWITDRESRTMQTVREGELFPAGNIAVTVTEIRKTHATFEAGGSSVKLALSDSARTRRGDAPTTPSKQVDAGL